jgi:VanZ family protein
MPFWPNCSGPGQDTPACGDPTTPKLTTMADMPLPPATDRFQRVLQGVFALTALVVMVLSLLPLGPEAPSLGWDKANHMTAFALLALLGCRAYPNRHIAVLTGLLAYGGLIEVLQSFTGYRMAEWADLLADALGLPVGWVVARWLGGLHARR